MRERLNLNTKYVAGFFDGEGSIAIVKNRSLRVYISNIHKPIIVAINKKYGGKFTDRSKFESKLNWRNSFSVHWNNKNGQDFLRKIQKYLIVKKEQCALALLISFKTKGQKNHFLSLEESRLRKYIYNRMKFLNNKKEYV